MASSVASYSILTLADARAHLDLAAEDVERDGVLVAVVNRVADLIESSTGRRFITTAYSNVFLDGNGTPSLFLPNYPVDLSAGVTVVADGARMFSAQAPLVVWDRTGDVISQEVIVDPEAGEATRIDGGVWPEGPATVRISYTAGYALGSVPQDLVHAALVQVADWWNRIGTDPQLAQMSEGGIAETFLRDRSSALSPVVRMILGSYSNHGELA